LHTFSGTDGDEIGLTGVGLLEGANGSFYGVTAYGTESSNGCGSIFKMSTQGVFTTLYGFSNTSTEGCGPIDGLVQTPNGDIYGTTVGGGTANDGTIFKMTAENTLTSLYSFCIESNCADGSEPDAGMILGTDGNFYGTTVYGGANNQGEIFQITPEGAFKVLYSFCSEAGCADGRSSYSRLIQATDGNFYGATSDDGGGNNGGTFFKLSMGLAPFVGTIPASGKVGTQVEILGSDLTGATSVSFNGTPAVFKVDSPTLIVATVPAKATTGKVRVSTPGGELLSNVAFRVSP
jgi:uncharacterized repeat protein (TIGR03803 family)